MPPTSVFRSSAPLVPVFVPPATPPAAPLTLPGKPPSLGPAWPYIRSISSPSTALVRPTSNVKSGRNRVRAYHSRSLSREKLPSYWFLPAAVIWSKVPLIVTFGAGACASAGGATDAILSTSTLIHDLLGSMARSQHTTIASTCGLDVALASRDRSEALRRTRHRRVVPDPA